MCSHHYIASVNASMQLDKLGIYKVHIIIFQFDLDLEFMLSSDPLPMVPVTVTPKILGRNAKMKAVFTCT